jgi:hypothetical protein
MRRFLCSGVAALLVLGAAHGECRADAGGEPEAGPGTRIGGFFRELAGYLRRSDRVGVGDVAPDFELVPLRFYDFDLGEPDAPRNAHADAYRGVRLSTFRGVRPVALVFGSYT